ncbi:pro-melanin-concentrating hormone, like [Notolabrus celidotus]|uniref:pro-melanin-concentrating hormone, like n=1 Tax=Notolabrus celidotus TaxID=1203425 RepID=UPI0014900535|nr:pro-melanin-concentrating hormone, like [Notolabrus celidotus]
MRPSVMPVIFTAALLFECFALSVALPMAKTEDSSLEQDGFTPLLSDEVTDNSLGELDLAEAIKTRGQRVIIIADPSLWRELRALNSGMSLYKRRADENGPAPEHRGGSQDLSIPILRRDTMRCMVGRVYRPCWEV